MASPTIIVSHIPPGVRRSRRRCIEALALRLATAICLIMLAVLIGSTLFLGE
jgi:hypothetical protein